jgi:CheY-like chemotaxis protein
MQGSGTILIVEDNPQVGDVSTMLLEQLGYRVIRVDRPQAALALLGGPNDVNVVFTDIVMPGDMDGLALARAIQERYADLPVLLATGYSSAAERAAAEFPILRKPYDQATLALAMKAAFAGRSPRQSTV